MRFRTGLLIGFGVGYVLGSKAGRERYEQIVSTARSLLEDERVRGVVDQVGEVAAEVVGAAREAAGEADPEDTSVETAEHGTSNGKI